MRFVRRSLSKVSGAPTREFVGARITNVFRVRAWLPSGWIKTECGTLVWRNSVAATVYFPRMDKPHNPVGRSNDCARVSLIAALTRGGWTVWGSS